MRILLAQRAGKLGPLDRVECARLLHWLRRTSRAMRMLGKLHAPAELRNLSREELSAQALLAQILNFVGAGFVAQEILAALDKVSAQRKLSFEKIFPHYYRIRAEILLLNLQYAEATAAYKIVQGLYAPGSPESQLTLVALADAAEAEGRMGEALKYLEAVKAGAVGAGDIYHGIAEQAAAEYYFRAGDFTRAAASAEAAAKFFPADSTSRDYAYLLKWQGIISLSRSVNQGGLEKLLRAREILLASVRQPIALLDLFYWVERFSPAALGLGEKIALRAYPSFSPYSALAGRNVGRPLPVWFAENCPAPRGDAWLLGGGKIEAVVYSDWKRARGDAPGEVLDLYAGIFTAANGERTVFSPLQARFLFGVIGAGSIGLHELALADFVYRQKFHSWENALERVRALAKEMRKEFPYWSRRGGILTLAAEALPPVTVLPMRFDVYHPIFALRGKEGAFRRQDLETSLRLSSRTASRLLRSAVDEGVVVADKSGRDTSYRFA